MVLSLVIDHIFGWEQRGGRRAGHQEKAKEKVSAGAQQSVSQKGCPLPPPQTCCSVTPCLASLIAGEVAAGYLPRARCRCRSSVHPPPAYLATDQKNILVFSKDPPPLGPHDVLNPIFKPLLVALGRTPGSPEDKTM